MLFMMVKFYAIDIIKMNGHDMKNTFAMGDVFLVKRVFNEYNTNDIIYFRFPLKDSTRGKTYCFQRLLGLPGDTVEIRDKKFFLNNFEISDTSSLKHNYYIKSDSVNLDSLFVARTDLNEGGKISETFDYSFSLTKYQADSLRRLAIITKVKIKNESRGSYDQTVFPYSIKYSWNMDNFGKLYLPKKNDTILLDSINLSIYSIIIRDYERNKLEVKNDSVFINNIFSTNYVIRQNYYFVLGDNRDNANDSRVFGFLPENSIRGKVIRVLKRAE